MLRNGRLVGEWPTAELPQVELVAKMLGHELETLEALERAAARSSRTRSRRRRRCSRPRRSAARARSRRSTSPSTPGEVVGLAGLLGSGRTELARLLFGADRADAGSVVVDGDGGHDAQPARADGARASPSAPRTAGPKGSSRS